MRDELKLALKVVLVIIIFANISFFMYVPRVPMFIVIMGMPGIEQHSRRLWYVLARMHI